MRAGDTVSRVVVGATLGALALLAGIVLTDPGGPVGVGAMASVSPTAGAAEERAEAEALLTVMPDGKALRLEGDLTEGVATRVSALLAAHPQVERIELASDGGLVAEAVALAALVGARGLASYVRHDCASACTLVFVHGRRRVLAAGGRLGFHAPYEEDAFGRRIAVDAAPERVAYREAGVAPGFTDRALATAFDDIWIPEPAELLAAGVVTEVVEVGASRLSRGNPQDLAVALDVAGASDAPTPVRDSR